MGLRILFLGTAEFAVPGLRAIHLAGYKIVAVVTATDKYGGRGRKQLIESPIKKEAKRLGLPVLQPPNLKRKTFVEQVRALKADLNIVIAFRMLPEVIWNMPPLGTYNLHASLLPKYRGAAPIHWAIIRGEVTTGLTMFKLRHEIDTGSILLQQAVDIGADETTGSLYNRLKELGAKLVLKGIKMIELDEVDLKEQDPSLATGAPKIFQKDCQICFDQPVDDVYNFIRGLSPHPSAWTKIGEKSMKIILCKKEKISKKIQANQWFSDNKSYLKISCLDGYIHILELKLSGKRQMSIGAFLNGTNLHRWSEHIDLKPSN